MSLKLDESFYQALLEKAAQSPRKRSHFNLHKELDEPVQRLCIALKRGTYIRPHHHPKSNKWELMLCLQGQICLVIFDKNGALSDKLTLSPGQALNGIELPPDTWHTLYPLSDDAILLEIKEGPFMPTQESDFASWAPLEGQEQATELLAWLENAAAGERFAASESK
ncbi:MAG: WbuC family cupin fold metalloprotein [Gammaproteobacteria bacterium]|nr:WbuC family cupin fold metalloprotein [Gammaproteobacteria bacterium]